MKRNPARKEQSNLIQDYQGYQVGLGTDGKRTTRQPKWRKAMHKPGACISLKPSCFILTDKKLVQTSGYPTHPIER